MLMLNSMMTILSSNLVCVGWTSVIVVLVEALLPVIYISPSDGILILSNRPSVFQVIPDSLQYFD
jgi:hypothetical protein